MLDKAAVAFLKTLAAARVAYLRFRNVSLEQADLKQLGEG